MPVATAEAVNPTYRKKFQFGTPPEIEKLLDSLQADTGTNSWSEVIRDALRAYAWIVDAHKQGFDVTLTEKDTKTYRLVNAAAAMRDRVGAPAAKGGHAKAR